MVSLRKKFNDDRESILKQNFDDVKSWKKDLGLIKSEKNVKLKKKLESFGKPPSILCSKANSKSASPLFIYERELSPSMVSHFIPSDGIPPSSATSFKCHHVYKSKRNDSQEFLDDMEYDMVTFCLRIQKI